MDGSKCLDGNKIICLNTSTGPGSEKTASSKKPISSRSCKVQNYFSALKYFIMDRFVEYFCIIMLHT